MSMCRLQLLLVSVPLATGLVARTALAFALEDAHHRPVIPVFRGDGAPGGDLDHETAQLEREAGIRNQL